MPCPKLPPQRAVRAPLPMHRHVWHRRPMWGQWHCWLREGIWVCCCGPEERDPSRGPGRPVLTERPQEAPGPRGAGQELALGISRGSAGRLSREATHRPAGKLCVVQGQARGQAPHGPSASG